MMNKLEFCNSDGFSTDEAESRHTKTTLDLTLDACFVIDDLLTRCDG